MEEVKIIPTQYGRGVAANRSWKEGEIIRISECIYLPNNQMPLKSQGSALWAYVFSAAKDGVLVSLDWTSLMNHSEDNFNVEYKPTDDNKIIFKASRDINPGDELLINYGYDVIDHNKHFGIDTDKLNEDTLQGFDMSASQGGVGLSSVKIFSDFFDDIDGLIEYVNSVFKGKDFDCSCFAYFVKQNFPDARIYFRGNPRNYHFYVEVGGKFYHKFANNPAGPLNEKGLLSSNIVFTTISSEQKPVIWKGGFPILNTKFLSEKIKRLEGESLIGALHDIRNVLFDAPDNVKEEFNQIVQYFAAYNPKIYRINTVNKKINGLQKRLSNHKYKDARNREIDTLRLRQYQAELQYLKEYKSLADKINSINNNLK